MHGTVCLIRNIAQWQLHSLTYNTRGCNTCCTLISQHITFYVLLASMLAVCD